MLFNTLANLRVLMTLDPPRAQAMLDHLIRYLRATLGASHAALHPLATEFAHLGDYLALMALRMGPRLQVQLHLPDTLRQHPVPPLLLQPLVENSIRHGLEPQVAGGRIEVSAALQAGQLLLTDDGDLLHRIIHPRTHAPKHYRVELSDPLRGDEAARFATGTFMLDGDDKPLRPAIWSAESAHSGVMILTEGRYHQIRRMFAALGNLVTALHRFQTGDLALGDLEAGQYKILGPEELASILGPPR